MDEKGKQHTPRENGLSKSHSQKEILEMDDVSVKTRGGCFKFERALEFADSVNCQGLPQLLQKESGLLRRLIWLAFILLGIALAVYQIQDRIIYYIGKPLATDAQIINEKSIPFPVVTLCNFNTFRRTVLDTPEAVALVEAMYPLNSSAEPDFSIVDPTWDSQKWRDFYFTAAHKGEQMLLECSYHGARCWAKDFKYIFTDMGLCFSFNAETNHSNQLYADSGGSKYGLSLTLDTQQDEYVRGLDGNTAGFKVLIHSIDDPPLMSSFGFNVGPGSHTQAALQLTSIHNLDLSDWGNCDISATLKYYTHYTHPGCVMECLTEYILHHCKCTMFYMPGNHTMCSPQEIYECYEPRFIKFIKEKGQCGDICRVACQYNVYEKSLSQAPMSNKFFKEYSMLTSKNESYWRDNYVKIDIFYKDIQIFRVIQNQAYSQFALGCDIGGALGLLLGASVLTILEIFDFIILQVLNGRGRSVY